MEKTRSTSIVILLLFLIFSATAGTDSLSFRIINYNNDGSVFRVDDQKILKTKNALDIHAYSKIFLVPHYLPKQFINKKHNNDTVVVWHDPKRRDDQTTNWSNTYIYDSHSRIRAYSYSCCTTCSDFPYNIMVTYNKKNQVVGLRNYVNMKNFFKMTYDEVGTLTQLKCYSLSKLSKVIELVSN